jgi:hypothetical protein
MRGGEGVDSVNGSREHLYQSYAKEDSMSGRTGKWGYSGWNKQAPKGKLILHNATQGWIPQGMAVMVKFQGVTTASGLSAAGLFETPEVKIPPGQQFSYQPPNDNNLRIIARSQVSGVKPVNHKIDHPLSQEDMHFNIVASETGSISLMMRRGSAH